MTADPPPRPSSTPPLARSGTQASLGQAPRSAGSAQTWSREPVASGRAQQRAVGAGFATRGRSGLQCRRPVGALPVFGGDQLAGVTLWSRRKCLMKKLGCR